MTGTALTALCLNTITLQESVIDVELRGRRPSVATEGDEGELGASFPLMDANPLSNLAEMPRGRRGSGNGTTRSSSGRATD